MVSRTFGATEGSTEASVDCSVRLMGATEEQSQVFSATEGETERSFMKGCPWKLSRLLGATDEATEAQSQTSVRLMEELTLKNKASVEASVDRPLRPTVSRSAQCD